MEEWLEKYRSQISIFFVALAILGILVLAFLLFKQKEPEIEIISSEISQKIIVHLEGAVEKPGVYELLPESRLNDLLIRAGGLAAGADRQWVNENLNLAQKLTDGSKIFIPEQQNNQTLGISSQSSQLKTNNNSGKTNINKASLSELDALWGVGQKRAEDIIKNRPYGSIEELLSKKIIPANVYEKIKDEITVY
jgi:competence protein ComEA